MHIENFQKVLSLTKILDLFTSRLFIDLSCTNLTQTFKLVFLV